MRFALVNIGASAGSFARIGPRLRGGEFSAVVHPDAASARRQAEQLGVSVVAASTQKLHERQSGAFDAWVADTGTGLLLAPHDNRPLNLETWSENPPGWMWGHPYRFLPSHRTVKESLDSGKLGAPGLVRIHCWRPRAAGNVRTALTSQLDLACWLMDQPPTVLFALSRRGDAPAADLDYVQVHLGFADDRMAVVDCAALPAGDGYVSLSVIASTGAAYADDHHNMQLLFRDGHPQALRTSQGDAALLATLQEFIDSVEKPRPPSCGAADWKRAQTLSAAVEQSLTTGQSVSLEGGKP